MERSPSSTRPCFKLRCVLVVAFFAVLLPGGHAALPQGIAFLRFLNSQYKAGLTDYAILACACGAVVATFLPWRRLAVVLDVIAFVLFLTTLVMVQRAWADPLDLFTTIATAVPWAVLTVVVILRDAVGMSERGRG